MHSFHRQVILYVKLVSSSTWNYAVHISYNRKVFKIPLPRKIFYFLDTKIETACHSIHIFENKLVFPKYHWISKPRMGPIINKFFQVQLGPNSSMMMIHILYEYGHLSEWCKTNVIDSFNAVSLQNWLPL